MKQNPTGCPEYRELSRRGLIARMGHEVVRHAVRAPSWLPTVAYDQEVKGIGRRGPGDRDILVSVYLRGGCDGLTVCAPYGDAEYYNLRSSLAVPRPDQTTNDRRGIDLDGFFALPQAMAALKPLYDADRFLVVHATGLAHNTRSHFDAQQFMEAGKADKSMWTGWLGRHLNTSQPMRDGAILRALGLSGQLALTLEGGPKTTAVSSLTDTSIGGQWESEAQRLQWLQAAYEAAPQVLRESGENTLKTLDLLKSLDYEHYAPGGGAQYNRSMPGGGGTYGSASDFGEAIRATAALIKEDVGVEAIHLDFGGWDTHEYQAPFEDYGPMFMNMWSLSTNLSALYDDLDAAGWMGRVTVVVVSEFGRTAQQNGNYGTDHGRGNVMLLLGNNVNGGRVMRQWPGLAPEQLFEGNALNITLDHRDILAEVVKKRLKNDAVAQVFPDYTPTYRGAVTG